jgi:hypothetical protein
MQRPLSAKQAFGPLPDRKERGLRLPARSPLFGPPFEVRRAGANLLAFLRGARMLFNAKTRPNP